MDMGVVFTGRANDTSLPMALGLRAGFARDEVGVHRQEGIR